MPAREKKTTPAPTAAAVANAPVSPLWRGLRSPITAAVLLVLFWFLQVACWWDRGFTYDEANHALAGYTYWKFGDFRIDPENGNLPQRVAGLALLADGTPPPITSVETWRVADQWTVSREWLFHSGNGIDPARFRRVGRAAMALFAVGLAALVWAWARWLFGPEGALVSLGLCVLSPMLLANGPLVTSDTALSLFFLAATGGYWLLLHRVSPGRVLLAGVATAGLFLSKMSAVFLVPIATVLLIARIVRREPLAVGWTRAREQRVESRGRRIAWLVGATIAQALVAWALLWSAYGFRFSAFAPGMAEGSRYPLSFEALLGGPRPFELLDAVKLTDAQTIRAVQIFRAKNAVSEDWTPGAGEAMAEIEAQVLEPAQRTLLAEARAKRSIGAAGRVIEFFHQHRLLPEAFLVGTAHARHGAQGRVSFLDGEVRAEGEPDYFPTTLLYKNPLAVFVIAALAGFAGWFAWCRMDRATRGERLYALLPLLALLACYWAFILPSRINIGHRHALPTYAPFFVLCGAAVAWSLPRAAGARKWTTWLVPAAFVLLVVEVASSALVNPIGYVNPLGGGSARAYRHICDSSLDWGQELPAVKRYVDTLDPKQPVYFSYFGNDSPRQHGIASARLIESFAGWDNDHLPAITTQVIPRQERGQFLAWLAAQRPDYELLAMSEGGSAIECAVAKKPEALRLGAGTYLISAAMVHALDHRADGPLGPWCERHEKTYQALRAMVVPLLTRDDAARQAMLDGHTVDELATAYHRYDVYRFYRLAAWLRHREPDTVIRSCVLVYHLTGADIQAALEAPPVELGRDLVAEYQAKVRARKGE